MNLLEIKNLRISFGSSRPRMKAVDGLSLSIKKGEIHCLVGESGCGKSVTAQSILRLISPPGRIDSGEILYNNKNILTWDASRMRAFRGSEVGMIFQDPMNSLNPVYTCGNQVAEPLITHRGYTTKQARTRVRELFELVHIEDPAVRIDQYPHELSGGMRQRVMIAMAMACNPALLIADEPTTALDVTVQAQILAVLRDLQKRLGVSILFITHDLGIVSQIAHTTTVLYAGRNCESGATQDILQTPLHPYTQGLLQAIPRLNPNPSRLIPIKGAIEDSEKGAEKCLFENRCPHAMDICRQKKPRISYRGKRALHCFLYGGTDDS
ncbi:MAG: ABC transporter ATP-binding protein [Fibrobacterota bacterium]